MQIWIKDSARDSTVTGIMVKWLEVFGCGAEDHRVGTTAGQPATEKTVSPGINRCMFGSGKIKDREERNGLHLPLIYPLPL